jgi:hypothetical protein
MMFKKICKKSLHCVVFLIVCIVILSFISPRTEFLGPTSGGHQASGSGTTSGGTSWGGAGGTVGAPGPGGGSTLTDRAYGFQAFLTGAQTAIDPPGYRLASTWHNCSPESHPYGCSAPEMSLTVPARGPFPYTL